MNKKITSFQIKKINERIQLLKEELQSSDYKVIKNIEYDFNLLTPPYDIRALHEERQSIRDKINELEQKIRLLEGQNEI